MEPDEIAAPELDMRSAPLPQLLCDVAALPGKVGDASGAVWRLALSQRQLDANVIRLRGGEGVAAHTEAHLDVLLLVLDGDGELATGATRQPLRAGALLWLPRGSSRQIAAGSSGLSYLTVHQRRPGLTIGPPTRS